MNRESTEVGARGRVRSLSHFARTKDRVFAAREFRLSPSPTHLRRRQIYESKFISLPGQRPAFLLFSPLHIAHTLPCSFYHSTFVSLSRHRNTKIFYISVELASRFNTISKTCPNRERTNVKRFREADISAIRKFLRHRVIRVKIGQDPPPRLNRQIVREIYGVTKQVQVSRSMLMKYYLSKVPICRTNTTD